MDELERNVQGLLRKEKQEELVTESDGASLKDNISLLSE